MLLILKKKRERLYCCWVKAKSLKMISVLRYWSTRFSVWLSQVYRFFFFNHGPCKAFIFGSIPFTVHCSTPQQRWSSSPSCPPNILSKHVNWASIKDLKMGIWKLIRPLQNPFCRWCLPAENNTQCKTQIPQGHHPNTFSPLPTRAPLGTDLESLSLCQASFINSCSGATHKIT